MSRPFSYNDENFTVIGNLLFCHIHITEDVEAGKSFVEIPFEIAKRLIYYTNSMVSTLNKTSTRTSVVFPVGVIVSSGRYYFSANAKIDASVITYVTGFYLLKDI